MSDAASEVDILTQLRNHPELFQAIQDSDLPELKLQQQLRLNYPPELVRNAITLAELRRRARDKFSRADLMWFSRQGLEQATPEPVATHKAQRFQIPSHNVFDLCCGIGSDSIALAARGLNVTSVDLSPAACLRTAWNAEVYAVNDHIQTLQADVTSLDLSEKLIHFDPDRRAGQTRAIRLEDYSPPLEYLQSVTQASRGGAIKLSPASNFGGKFPDCEIELISLHGECKEATVWFGELASDQPFRATMLPSGFTMTANPFEFDPELGELGDFLYDPDPAIVRAGLLDALTVKFQLVRLDQAEEYLTSDKLVNSPAVTPFRVLSNLPNNPKDIGKYLRANPCGELEIKCRHVPIDVDQMRKRLPITGTGKLTLFFARLDGKTRAIVAERIAA